MPLNFPGGGTLGTDRGLPCQIQLATYNHCTAIYCFLLRPHQLFYLPVILYESDCISADAVVVHFRRIRRAIRAQPNPMLHRRHYIFALSVAASVPFSVRPVFRPVPNIFLPLRKIKLNGFRWNSRETITTVDRSNGYILGEIGKGTSEQDTRENSNQRQSLLPRS